MLPDEKDCSASFSELSNCIAAWPAVAVAFSGGIDSAVLLRIAAEVLGHCNVIGIHVQSCFFPRGTAQRPLHDLIAHFSGKVRIDTIEFNPLSIPAIAANDPDRCYYCKKAMYCQLTQYAQTENFCIVADGTNADDRTDNRPGYAAIKELGVKTPLRQCHISKNQIRAYAKKMGLPHHDLPAQSCLATRIFTPQRLTEELLKQIDDAEQYLSGLGFSDFRVRFVYGVAHVEVRSKCAVTHVDPSLLSNIKKYFYNCNFSDVTFDFCNGTHY